MSDAHETVYGMNPIREAILSSPEEVSEVLLARDRRDPRVASLLQLCEVHHIPVHPRPSDVLNRLAGNPHHQGVVAMVRGFQYQELEDLPSLLANRLPLLVMLDGIQDPQNLGALIRTAHVMGADAVIIPKDLAAGVGPGVRKASAGALSHIPIVRVVNVARAMEQLFEEQGIWWVGLDATAPTSLEATDLTVPLGLVIGAEGTGLRPLTRKRCQLLAKIPSFAQTGDVDSLNASAAGAVALYETLRQRSRVSPEPSAAGHGAPSSGTISSS